MTMEYNWRVDKTLFDFQSRGYQCIKEMDKQVFIEYLKFSLESRLDFTVEFYDLWKFNVTEQPTQQISFLLFMLLIKKKICDTI